MPLQPDPLDFRQLQPVTFRYSPTRLVALVLGMGLVVVFFSYLFFQDGGYLWLLAVPLLMLVYLAWEFISRIGSLTIDAEGIRRTGLLGGEKSIRWSDLTVQADWTRRHLLLRDSLGENKILLDNDLENFAQAVELVRRRRLDLFQAELRSAAGVSGEASFKLLSLVPIIVVGVIVVFMVVTTALIVYLETSRQGEQGAAATQMMWLILLMMLPMLGLPFVFIALQPLSVRLDPHELVVRYVFGTQRLPVRDIQDVRMEMIYAGKSGRQTTIHIVPRQGKAVQLRGQYSGGPWLYCLLKTWWEGRAQV